MPPSKQVYKNPNPGQPLISTISSGCKTPVLAVKFCNLVKPFFYPNSLTIPRYSITCLVDPEVDHEFIKTIQTIEKNESVDSIIKNDTAKEGGERVNTGKVLLKFQSKEIIPVFQAGTFEKGEAPAIDLEDELGKGERVVIYYDILRYTKKNTMKVEHGLSFKPTAIYLYSQNESGE